MNKENGNVLFLILIAVALFAALSYAVTQSSRGGGNADEERRIIEISEWLQFVGSIRTTIQRMVLNGTAPSDIELCIGASPDFCGLGTGFNDFCTSGVNCVFSQEGGGLAYPREFGNITIYLLRSGNARSVDGVGTVANDMIALFQNDMTGSLTESQCVEINKGAGVSTSLLEEVDGDQVYAETLALSGSWDFCYDSNSSPNTQYVGVHVLQAE